MSVVPASPRTLVVPRLADAARPATQRCTSERRSSVRRTLATLVILVVLVGALWLRRDTLASSFARIGDLPLPWLLAVVGATVAMVLARAAMVAAATPGLTTRQALAADQVQVASSNAVVGGGPLGASAKVGMLHSWGVKSDDIATSLIATAIVPALVTWSLALGVFWPAIALGEAGRTEFVLAVMGTVQLIGFGVLLWIALTKPVLAAVVGNLAGRVVGLVGRLVPARFDRIHRLLAGVDPHDWLERLRQDGQTLARTHGVPTLLATVAGQIATWFLMWSILHGVGVADVSIGEVVLSLTLVRALVSVSPTPGGVGVAEMSLIASLTNAGGASEAVTAAVVLFRSLTYVLPMVLGSAAWVWFRRPAVLRRTAASDYIATQDRIAATA